MFEHTDTKAVPWFIAHSNDKRRARLNIIAHILGQVPYKRVEHTQVNLPERSNKGKYDDHASVKSRHFIIEQF